MEIEMNIYDAMVDVFHETAGFSHSFSSLEHIEINGLSPPSPLSTPPSRVVRHPPALE